jgi:[ribosomal protein S5]-alanine N-acetyltransferase
MTKYLAIQLHTQRLQLIAPRLGIADAILDFFETEKDFLTPWSPTFSQAFYTRHFQQKKIRDEQQLLKEKKSLRLWIFDRNDAEHQKVLGQIHFSNIVWGGFCSCYLGYSMAESATGKGLITEALYIAIAYVFQHWHLHRIEANIMPRNLASIRVVEKLGFVHEGRSINYLKINGQWEDHDHYVLRNLALE